MYLQLNKHTLKNLNIRRTGFDLLSVLRFLLPLALYCGLTPILAQGPISGFATPKGEVVFALNYAYEDYDRYFLAEDEGEEDRELAVTSYSLFVEAGLSENTSIVASLPYLSTGPDNQGLQDASLWVKYQNIKSVTPDGQHNLFTAVGLTFPVSGYATGEPDAIGNQATVFNGRLAYQYRHNSGAFISAVSGLDFQISPESQLAWPFLLRGGYGGRFFYLEGWVELVRALDGRNLNRSAVAGTGSSWNRLGATLYVPITSALGLNAGGAWITGGELIGASSRYNVGVVAKLWPGGR